MIIVILVLINNIAPRPVAERREGAAVYTLAFAFATSDAYCAVVVAAVPAVLDHAVGAAGKQLGDLRPAVAQRSVGLSQDFVLLCSPPIFLDAGVDVVVPALTTLNAEPKKGTEKEMIYVKQRT